MGFSSVVNNLPITFDQYFICKLRQRIRSEYCC